MNRRPIIGIRIPEWVGGIAYLLGGVVDYMRVHAPWQIVTENDSFGEMEGCQIGIGWQGDGLILYRASEEELKDFRERGIAVVLLSREGPDGGFPRVVPNNRKIGQLAAKYLMSLGFRSFAFLARGEKFYREEIYAPGIRIYARERLAGYKEELATSGYEPEVYYLPGFPIWEKNTWKEIQKTVGNFLEEMPLLTGLFCVDDVLATIALKAAESINRLVPDELAIIGFGNDLNYCYASFPALSSIGYPGREAGYQASHFLDLQLKQAPMPTFPFLLDVGRIYERESTEIIAIEDVEIKKLVRWIRLQAPSSPIHVNELQEHTSLSSSSIKARFKKYLGHGPKEEIKRRRLNHLQHLLCETSCSFSEITKTMQFASPHEMSRFLYRETGERPSTFREKCRLNHLER